MSRSIKFVHTGDFHLGASFKGLFGKNVGELRREDFRENLRHIVDFALEKNIDLFLISGDVFHSIRPASNEFVFFSEQVGRLTSRGIKVVVIAGNHDKPKVKDVEHELNALVRAHAPNFYFYQGIVYEPLIIDLRGVKVGIVPLPYVDYRVVEELGKSFNTFIRGVVNRLLDSDSLSNVDYKILIGHLIVSGAKISEIPILYLKDKPVSLDDLRSGEFDYLALGHIHMFQSVSENAYYCGSIEKLDFSEASEEKFFIYGELSDGGVSIEPIKLRTRRMHILRLSNLTNVMDPVTEIANFLRRWGVSKGDLVKLFVSGSQAAVESLKRRISQLAKYLDDLGVVGYKIDFETRKVFGDIVAREREIRYNILDIVRDYIKGLSGVSEEVKKRALKYAEKIIEEVGPL